MKSARMSRVSAAIALRCATAHIRLMNGTALNLRVASYNVRKCVGLDRRRDPDRVMSVIAGIEADVVALQEADRRLGDRPATLDRDRVTAETGLHPVEVALSEVSLGWHGNAVLFRPGIEVGLVSRVDLPALEPRGAVMVEARRDGAPFRVVAAHLGLSRSHRRRQLAVIAAAVAQGAEMPTIILGDFNEWRQDRGLEPLDDGFTVHAPGRSFHAARPVAALDRIAVSPTLELTDAGVVETRVSRIASDHLPIWADLSAA